MSQDKKHILIVEDEKPLARALALKLSSSGFDTEAVSDGETALERIRKGGLDLIVLDLILPRRDGFSILEELRKSGISTPVVVASNLGQEEDLSRAMALGAKAYFVKSDIQISQIAEQIKRIIGA